MSQAQQTAAKRLEAARAREPEFVARIEAARAGLEKHKQAVGARISQSVAGVALYGETDRADDRRKTVDAGIVLADSEAELAAFQTHVATLETQAAAEAVLAIEAEVETMKAAVDNAAAVILEAWPNVCDALGTIESAMFEIQQLERRREKAVRVNKLNPPTWGSGRARDGSTWAFNHERFFDCLCAQFQKDAYGKMALSPTALVEHAPRRTPPGK